MAHSVTIKTPVPTLEELGENLGLSKTRQRSLIAMFQGKAPARPANLPAYRKSGATTPRRKKKSKRVSPSR